MIVSKSDAKKTSHVRHHLIRVSKAAVAPVAQQSNARWNVILQEQGAAVALATRINSAVISSSIPPFSRRA